MHALKTLMTNINQLLVLHKNVVLEKGLADQEVVNLKKKLAELELTIEELKQALLQNKVEAISLLAPDEQKEILKEYIGDLIHDIDLNLNLLKI